MQGAGRSGADVTHPAEVNDSVVVPGSSPGRHCWGPTGVSGTQFSSVIPSKLLSMLSPHISTMGITGGVGKVGWEIAGKDSQRASRTPDPLLLQHR